MSAHEGQQLGEFAQRRNWEGTACRRRSAGREEAAWGGPASPEAERTPREGAARRSAPCRDPPCFFWTIPKVFPGILACCLRRGELSDPPGFLRQMPYKHQSLALSTLSQGWLSRVEPFFPLPYVKGTCFQEKCPLNIQLKLEVIFCMNGFLRLGLQQNKTCIKLSATLHIVFQGKRRIYCHVNDVHGLVSYWTSHVPLSPG